MGGGGLPCYIRDGNSGIGTISLADLLVTIYMQIRGIHRYKFVVELTIVVEINKIQSCIIYFRDFNI